MNELRVALRTLLKSPGFLTLSVLTMALGVAAATVIFSVTESILWRPLPFAAADRLVLVWEQNLKRAGRDSSVSAPEFADWRSQVRSMDALAGMTWGESRNLSIQGAGERVRVRRISAGFLEMLGVQPAMGRPFDQQDEQFATSQPVILSHDYWQRHFAASPGAIGQSLRLDGEPCTVVGVLPAGFHLEFVEDTPVLLPLVLSGNQRRDARNLAVIGRLKTGSGLQQAVAEMESLARESAAAYPQTNTGWTARVGGLRESITSAYRRDLFLYLGFGGFVLLIACANVAGLLLVRSVGRQKEFALRAALGAGRTALWRQALAETAWIAIPGGILGAILSAWGVAAMHNILPPDKLLRANQLSMDFSSLAFVLAVSLASAFAFALAPALTTSHVDLDRALRDWGKSVAAHPRVARRIDALIAAEIMLAFLLLFGAGLFLSSNARLHQIRLGFDPHSVLTVRISPGLAGAGDAELRAFHQRLLGIARQETASDRVALSGYLPILGASSVGFAPAGRPRPPQGEELNSLARPVTPAYFDVMGIPLLQGRAFTEGDSDSSPRVAIVNENLARRVFGRENPVGRSLEILPRGNLSIRPGPVEIVGLAPNTKEVDLNEVDFNDIYFPLAQHPLRAVYVAAKTSAQPDSVAAALRHDLGALDPEGAVYDPANMEARVADSLAGERFNLALVSIFATLALLLAGVGVYGAISFSAAQRTREFGLRLALGAAPRSIVAINLARTARLALAGAGSGLLLAIILGALVKSALYLVPGQHGGVLYGVGIHDPISLAGAAAILLGLAALAGVVPAAQASRIEPLTALRHEA